MARLILRYSPRQTVLHAIDPRLKLFLLMLASSVLFPARGRGLVILALATIAALLAGRIPLARLARETLLAAIPAGLLFVSRAFLTPGTPPGAAAFWKYLPVTTEGLILGTQEAGRLLILFFQCHVFISVTPVSDIQRGAAFFAGKKAALLARLSFAMIPSLLDAAGDILASAGDLLASATAGLPAASTGDDYSPADDNAATGDPRAAPSPAAGRAGRVLGT